MGEAGAGEQLLVDDDEQASTTSEDGAVRVLDLSLVEELASLATQMTADKKQRLVERRGAEIVDLHVAGHCEDVERPVKFTHGFVKQSRYDAAVNVAGWAFVQIRQLDVRGGGGGVGVSGVDIEAEMEALRISRAAAEAVTGSLVQGWIAVHCGGASWFGG